MEMFKAGVEWTKFTSKMLPTHGWPWVRIQKNGKSRKVLWVWILGQLLG